MIAGFVMNVLLDHEIILQTEMIFLFTKIDARHHRSANLEPVHKLLALTSSLFSYRSFLKSKFSKISNDRNEK